jgi:hypothetical protein
MNALAVINHADALAITARSLGIDFKSGEAPTLSRALVAQALRRAIFNAAPCAPHALRSLVFVALSPLADDPEALKVHIEDALHDLIAAGDILEMRAASGERSDIVLRPAPPAFVARRDGSFIIVGISGDEITPIREPSILHHESGLRSVRVADVQKCRAELLDLGLIELPERLWLHAPATSSAHDLAAHWKARLPTEPRPEKIEGLEILDAASSTAFYKGRWTSLHPKHSGFFVVRRPQRFGANLWCLADIKDGVVQRFTDIRAKDSRTRDCDEAWRLRAALDAVSGAPQTVSMVADEASAILSFTAPLPAWAARRLGFLGEQVTVPRALLAFRIPIENVQDELRWLGENLWLVRNDKGGTA